AAARGSLLSGFEARLGPQQLPPCVVEAHLPAKAVKAQAGQYGGGVTGRRVEKLHGVHHKAIVNEWEVNLVADHQRAAMQVLAPRQLLAIRDIVSIMHATTAESPAIGASTGGRSARRAQCISKWIDNSTTNTSSAVASSEPPVRLRVSATGSN